MLFALFAAALAAEPPAPVRVSLTASDGAVIVADDYAGGERGVVLAHGGRRSRAHWRPLARVLAEAGFHVVAIDFRGFGESPRPASGREGDPPYARDVLAAVRYLRERGARTVSVVGGSFGGGAAAQAVVEAPPGTIDRLVLLAHASIAEPECLFGPKLFITARDDRDGSGRLRLDEIRKQYERAPEPKTLVVLDGDGHAQFVFESDQGERLTREIVTFLSAP